jgi:pimeloyl-ACP methyl ester carboxylesterase
LRFRAVTSPHTLARVATFALIHGSHHGAWCWDYLVPELRGRGHATVAVDLPCEDTSAGVSRYTEVVLDALRGVKGDVIAVGHSGGGLVLPVLAARTPVKRMVFLAAVIPEPGLSLAEQRKTDPGLSAQGVKIAHEDGTVSRPPDEAIRRYYHDCTEEQIRWALPRLRRQAQAPSLEPSPIATWPEVPSTYIVCAQDRALDPAWEREVARRRLGVSPLEIDSSHSPFLSRPAELADLLVSTLRA